MSSRYFASCIPVGMWRVIYWVHTMSLTIWYYVTQTSLQWHSSSSISCHASNTLARRTSLKKYTQLIYLRSCIRSVILSVTGGTRKVELVSQASVQSRNSWLIYTLVRYPFHYQPSQVIANIARSLNIWWRHREISSTLLFSTRIWSSIISTCKISRLQFLALWDVHIQQCSLSVPVAAAFLSWVGVGHIYLERCLSRKGSTGGRRNFVACSAGRRKK